MKIFFIIYLIACLFNIIALMLDCIKNKEQPDLLYDGILIFTPILNLFGIIIFSISMIMYTADKLGKLFSKNTIDD